MSAPLLWSVVAVLFAGASVLLAAQLYASWRVARWQAAETARLVRLAIFGPDPLSTEEQRVVREALNADDGVQIAQTVDVFDPVTESVVPASVAVEGGRLGSAISTAARLVPVHDADDLRAIGQSVRSAIWADPPQGSARVRRKPPADE